MGKMSESILPVRPRTKPLIYLAVWEIRV